MSEYWNLKKTQQMVNKVAFGEDSWARFELQKFGRHVKDIIRSQTGGGQYFPNESAINRMGANIQQYSGYCSASESAGFLAGLPRVAGYLRAIAREPSPKTVLDAGCGSSAILGIAAAILHPDSEVTCVEINKNASDCAREVIDSCGLSSRIEVVAANVLTMEHPPDVDLTVSETFGKAMLSEKGPYILSHLANTSGRLLPRFARVYASDTHIINPNSWQSAGLVDFRNFDGKVEGHIIAIGSGPRPLRVWTGYANEENSPVLADAGVDHITQPYVLGHVSPEVTEGSIIKFGYTANDRASIEILV